MQPEKTWTMFQAHFIEVQADLKERKQTYRQGGYHAGTVNNAMEMSMVFENISQATEEDLSAVTNLATANSTLTEQVTM